MLVPRTSKSLDCSFNSAGIPFMMGKEAVSGWPISESSWSTKLELTTASVPALPPFPYLTTSRPDFHSKNT